MNEIESLLVPSSLLRVRQFMSQSGLKVRPWASPAEALDAFDQLLEEHKRDQEFWARLAILVADLTRDLERRIASPESAVHNEVLDPSEHERLMLELRSALQRRNHPGFCDFARTLSQPAVATLCVMAGVALVGCGGLASGRSNRGGQDDGIMTAEGGQLGSGGTQGLDSGTARSVSTGGARGGTSGVTSDVPASVGTGGQRDLQLSTAPQSQGGALADAGTCELAIGEILTACNVEPTLRDRLLNGIAQLNDSWQAGIRRVLACKTCSEVQNELCRIEQTCNDPELGDAFSLEEFVDHCVVVLYRGVAFE